MVEHHFLPCVHLAPGAELNPSPQPQPWWEAPSDLPLLWVSVSACCFLLLCCPHLTFWLPLVCQAGSPFKADLASELADSLQAGDSGGSWITLAPGTLPRATNPRAPV